MSRIDTDPDALMERNADDNFARRLRKRREKMGVTRRQLAAASGTSERYLAHLESGAGNPSLAVLQSLADTLDLPMAELLPAGGERTDLCESVAAKVRRLREEDLTSLDEWIEERLETTRRGKGKRICLLGLRGAGKSTLGRLLAKQRAVPFLEMTQMIEHNYGGSISVLMELAGPAGFRRHERKVWKDIIDSHPEAVIAAPGGIVANTSLYDRVLATSHTIWLQATPEEHMARVMQQGDFRPMASNRSAMDDLKAILASRSEDYRRADATLDTSNRSLEQSMDDLAALADQLLERSEA